MLTWQRRLRFFLQKKTWLSYLVLDCVGFGISFPLTTHLMEKRVVKAIIIPSRFVMSVTKYSTNIGTVVSSGAKIVQTMSAAIEIFSSLYSVGPDSTSAPTLFFRLSISEALDTRLELTFERLATRRWNAPSRLSPAQRSKRSLCLCFEERATRSLFKSFSWPLSAFHASLPHPLSAELLPSVPVSQPRRKLKSCLLGPSCLLISSCCIKAEYRRLLAESRTSYTELGRVSYLL